MSRVLPILFNTENVRAILDGRKTVTRRVVKAQHLRVLDSQYHREHPKTPDKVLIEKLCEPPYQPDTIMYVRETWGHGYEEGTYIYKADDKLAGLPTFKNSAKLLYKPSIHMPKEAARIFLRVTDVRVEQLWDITEDGAFCEGVQTTASFQSTRLIFRDVWNRTVKSADRDLYGWDANPYVWVIEFERCEKPEVRNEGQGN